MSEIPLTNPADKGKMLPGIAGISLLLLLLTSLNVFGAVRDAFGTGPGKYGILTLCSMLVAGLFGLLRMRRWGWSIVLAGCLLLAAGDTYFYTRVNVGFFLVRAFFMLVFFFYLVRPEVRGRML
jgi:hypothetical protein